MSNENKKESTSLSFLSISKKIVTYMVDVDIGDTVDMIENVVSVYYKDEHMDLVVDLVVEYEYATTTMVFHVSKV
ncbi:hypothetical protein [Bacillus cereus]|uniref:hypothetical protein n=1 Tax=Bacillus cereus TaxID=1396 RepID=UPI001C3F3E99|nr:hypothetical protein [Bacillus cereus]